MFQRNKNEPFNSTLESCALHNRPPGARSLRWNWERKEHYRGWTRLGADGRGWVRIGGVKAKVGALRLSCL